MDGTLLILHPGALGDLIVSFPVISRLKTRFSDTLGICQGGAGQLAVHLGILARARNIDTAAMACLWGDGISPELRDLLAGCAAVVCIMRSPAPADLLRRSTTLPVYLWPPRPDPAEPIHVARHLMQLAEADQLCPSFGAARKAMDASFPPGAVSHPNGPLLLHPGSGSARKNWPLTRFGGLAQRLRGQGFAPTFLLGPAESGMAAAIRESYPGIPIAEPSGLVALADTLRRSRAYIGHDSGVTHLSAWLGLPTVALFGPSDPRRWRPVGRAVSVVRAGLDCSPCFELRPENCHHMDCLNGIDEEMVLSALHALVDRRA